MRIPADGEQCPCGSGQVFGECCRPLVVDGLPADTPLALMRSRFTASAIDDAEHMLRTWHPKTRPAQLIDLGETTHWDGLEVLDVTGGPAGKQAAAVGTTTQAPAPPVTAVKQAYPVGTTTPVPPPGTTSGKAAKPVERLYLTPAVTGFEAPELVNPGRGQYQWYGLVTPRAGGTWPAWPGVTLEYHRYTWRDVEPSPGVYDFSAIDAAASAAASRGHRYAFRVMPANHQPYRDGDTGPAAPTATDLQSLNLSDPAVAAPVMKYSTMPAWALKPANAWFYRDPDGASVVPDWNDADYQRSWTALITALGRRYDTDDRIGYVDVMGYGDWGEWHNYPFEQVTAPQAQAKITDTGAVALVDANLRAFPTTRLVSLTGQQAAFTRALSDPRTGIRVDCLGDAMAGWALANLQGVPVSLERWKSAPFVTEWCQLNYSGYVPPEAGADVVSDVGRDLFQVGRKQVMNLHVSLLSGGNFPQSWNGTQLTAQQYLDFSMANKTSGYRYAVTSASVPVTMRPGAANRVSTTWTNYAVAPTYDRWRIELQLRRQGNGEVAASTVSGARLDQVYALSQSSSGTGQVTPAKGSVTFSDDWALPATLAPGSYDLVARVMPAPAKAGATLTMPASYYAQPIALAMPGRTADGGYVLGSVSVG